MSDKKKIFRQVKFETEPRPKYELRKRPMGTDKSNLFYYDCLFDYQNSTILCPYHPGDKIDNDEVVSVIDVQEDASGHHYWILEVIEGD